VHESPNGFLVWGLEVYLSQFEVVMVIYESTYQIFINKKLQVNYSNYLHKKSTSTWVYVPILLERVLVNIR
jgi:hypothetical protein